MSTHEKQNLENVSINSMLSQTDSETTETRVVQTTGSGNSPGSICPACGFPRISESTKERKFVANSGICPVCGHILEISKNGYFVVSRDIGDPFDIAYQWISAENADIPVAKEKLLKEIITTNTIIKSLYYTADADHDTADQEKNTAIKEKYFVKLLSLAQAGLTGAMARPELAALALERLKVEIITVEGQRIKNTI